MNKKEYELMYVCLRCGFKRRKRDNIEKHVADCRRKTELGGSRGAKGG